MLCLDQAVTSLGGDNPKSMDCIFRIGSYNVIQHKFSNPRWLLVELKLNSTVARNDREDLLGKVYETEKGLQVDSIDPSRNFIYRDDVFPQKSRYFESWKRGSNGNVYKNWKCFTPSGFEKFLLFKENLPYQPENTTVGIQRHVTSCKNLEEFDFKMRYWKKRAEEYSLRGNKYESDHVLTSLNVIFQSYIGEIPNSEEKEYLSEEWNFLEKYGLPNDFH